MAGGASDDAVLELAHEQQRIVLTEDRDFGQLVFAFESPNRSGVVYIRCPEWARSELPERIASLIRRYGSDLSRSFVVWTPRHVRVRSLPEGR